MIRLSDRLKRIAEDISAGETMADVGTDHGFLPVYLRQCGKCPHVILTDVSAASLDKAKETARQHGFWVNDRGDGAPGFVNDAAAAAGAPGFADNAVAAADAPGFADNAVAAADAPGMDFRTGDGLSVLKPFEVDTVVIAGMGGKLIRDIMAADRELTYSFRKFVLQPRISQGRLRKWLADNGFIFVREGLVKEGRHIPEIITVLSPGQKPGSAAENRLANATQDILKEAPAKAETLKVPPWIIYADGPVEEFLSRSISREREKLENIRLAKERNAALEDETIKTIEYYDGLMEAYKDGKQK